MFDFNKVPLPDYTRLEDTINSVSHALGVPVTFVIIYFLLKKVEFHPTGVQLAALIIYAISMTVLYFGSAFYHGLKPSRAKRIARVLDHSNIFLMIAGTLSGFNLVAVVNYNRTLAIILTVVSWVVASIGILLTVMDQERFKKVQMVMYIALGWSALIGAIPIWASHEDAGKQLMLMIIVGGLLYMTGAALYGVGKKVRYIHAVFHVFILSATIVQSIGIYNYIA